MNQDSNGIEYHGGQPIRVYLNGKKVGEIKTVTDGYQYYPTGSKTGGDVYPTVTACKQSLEQG